MHEPNQLGEAPIRSLFFKYYIPALTSILSLTFHQVINGIIVGQQVGKEGLAAVGLYGPVVILLVALALPVMVGSGILLAKSIGAASYANAQTIFQFATTLALVFGGIIALSSPFLAASIARFLAGTENASIVRPTTDYVFWQFIGLPFFFLGMFWGNFIRNDNAPHISRNASLIAVTLNIFLDLVFIIRLDMGVAGASLATALSSLAGVLYLFFHIRKGTTHFGFRNFQFTLRFREWKELLWLGIPSFASEIAFSADLLLINQSIVPYGSLAVAAFGLVNYVSFIFIWLFTAAMIASLPIMSFNIGAKSPQRVLEIFRFSLMFTLLAGLIVAALGLIFPNLPVNLFAGHETEAFKQTAGRATALYFTLFIAAGPNYIVAAYLQSIGKITASVLINILKGFAFIALFLTLLPGYFQMGLSGIWLSRSLAEICTLLLVGVYTFCNRENYYADQVIVSRN